MSCSEWLNVKLSKLSMEMFSKSLLAKLSSFEQPAWRQPFFYLSQLSESNTSSFKRYLGAGVAGAMCIKGILTIDDRFDHWNSVCCASVALAGFGECIARKLMHGHVTWIRVCCWIHSWTSPKNPSTCPEKKLAGVAIPKSHKPKES